MNKHFHNNVGVGGNRGSSQKRRVQAVTRDWARDPRVRMLDALREGADLKKLLKEYEQYRLRSVSVQAAKIVRILHLLGAPRVSNLAAKCRMTPHLVSAELGRLIAAGLVKVKIEGGERRYFVCDPILASALILANEPDNWQPPTESRLLDSLRVDYPRFPA